MSKRPNKPISNQLRKQLNLASQKIQAGQASEVLAGLTVLAQQNPKNPLVFDLLCSCNNEMGRRQESIDAGKRSVELAPQNYNARIRYAMSLQAGGEYEEALIECERALYFSPDNTQALKTILSIYTDLGDHPKALEALERLESTIARLNIPLQDTIGVSLNKARLSPKPLPPEPVIEELIPLAENTDLPSGFRLITYHHLGRLFEGIKDHDNAIKYWTKGNELNKPKWNPDIQSKYIDKLIHCWKGIDKVPPAQSKFDSSRLIFVVGMMRSGTSLTEQMLAQLPNLTPGGEMNAISRSVFPFESLPNPQGAHPLPVSRLIYNQRVINKMAEQASILYNEVATEGLVTDKQPYNVFLVPLIRRMFPDCKIIHCARDAQDCCLSNYQQTYARPHPETHDLYWLGRYHADYQRMVKAWHQIPEIDMLDVQYEETVADPETQSKRVCEYIGQPWTQDILNFHKSSRTVRTASRDQVRQPIYKSSVKKHSLYAAHLAPLRQGLGIDQD